MSRARRTVRPLLLCATLAAPSGGQSTTGSPAVDSASAARAAYGRAIRADDLRVARHEIDRAAAAWPAQHAYLWARAILSARAGDSAATFDALQRYADLGLGRDLSSAKDFASLRSTARFTALTKLHARNREPLVASRVVHQIADSSFWPEGVDHDPLTGSFYVSSVRRGTIMRIDSAGRAHELWSGDSLRVGAAMGVRVDTARRVLWATTSGIPQWAGFEPADTGVATLLQIGLDDGRVRRRWDFPVVRGGHMLGDLAVAPGGDVFITDSNQRVLYRLRSSADTIDAITNPLFNSLQGLAPTPDGKSLYLADYSHGLLHLDLATGVIRRVEDAPGSTSLGCDGIAWYRGSIVAVQNGVAPARIMRFHLDASGLAFSRAEVVDRNVFVADEPTIGTIVGNEFVYVANSQWEKHDESGRLKTGARVVGLTLLGVLLR